MRKDEVPAEGEAEGMKTKRSDPSLGYSSRKKEKGAAGGVKDVWGGEGGGGGGSRKEAEGSTRFLFE